MVTGDAKTLFVLVTHGDYPFSGIEYSVPDKGCFIRKHYLMETDRVRNVGGKSSVICSKQLINNRLNIVLFSLINSGILHR